MSTSKFYDNPRADLAWYNNSLMHIIGNCIKRDWNAPSFSDYGTSVSYTHGQMAEEIEKLHILFKNAGINRGDKIALCEKSCSNWAIAFFATFTYGAVVVPILHDFSIEQIENITLHSDSKLLFCGKRFFNENERIPKDQLINLVTLAPFKDVDSQLTDQYTAAIEEFENRYPEGMQPDDVAYEMERLEDLALLSYTSGSTGNPKGVMVPYRAIWSNTIFAEERLPLEHNGNVISLLPLAHMYGFAFEFFYAWSIGSHIHFLTKAPSPKVILNAFNELQPVIILAVPLIIEKIIQKKVFPMLRKANMRSMLHMPLINTLIYRTIRKQLLKAFGGRFYEIILGGAAVNSDVEEFLHRIKFPYCVGYGMTECAPLICYEDYHSFVKGSCGKAIKRMEVKVLSEDPQNVPGEIVCRGMNVMLGYYKNPEATAEAIDAEGWLHTGDLGVIDAEGNVFIRGRKKNLLLGANGQNIYPEEVEDKINGMDVFDECVVVQREDKLYGLIYTSDATLESQQLTRQQFIDNLDTYRREINARLPKFATLTALELRDEPFEKTPKQNIKRFLYS